MGQCFTTANFYKYFKENMAALGAPAPSSLFGSYTTAVATAQLMLEPLKKLGKGATVGELIGATTGLEKIKVAAAFGASAYVGIVIGSIAVATGRSLGCGARLSDVFAFINRNQLNFPGSRIFFTHHKAILDERITTRRSVAFKAQRSPASFEFG